MKFRFAVALWAPVVAGLAGSCISPPVECPLPVVTQNTPVRVGENVKNKVDILFMIDNSPSMTPKQTQLKTEFPLFIDKLNSFATMGSPAWYHIGVVTSDLGAGPTSLGNGACVPGGQGGKLQALPAANSGQAGCLHVGNDTSTQMPASYIDYNQLMGTDNLPAGQDIKATFTCMADVGDQGCGFEHQLESVYRALHDVPAENQGFLRDDALLAVVFVTDEDDCSAPPNTDLFDPSQSQYGVANSSYRCTQFGLEYGMPPTFPLPSTQGTLMDIASAPNPDGDKAKGHLWDIGRYISFFGTPKASGGVKASPDDVILVTISAPVNSDSIDVKVTSPCENNMNIASCPVLVHSCTLASDPTNFFGDPAVRISSVVNSLTDKTHSVERSICDPPSYVDALSGLAAAIVSAIGAGCLGAPIDHVKDNPDQPDCVVEDITTDSHTGVPVSTTIPWCGKDACDNKSVGATADSPCWCLVDRTGAMNCAPVFDPDTGTTETLGVAICREATCNEKTGSTLVPPNTTARVECATKAIKTTPDGGTTSTTTGSNCIPSAN